MSTPEVDPLWTGSTTLSIATFGESNLQLARWDAEFQPDDPEDPFGLTVDDKRAGIALAQQVWDAKSADALVKRSPDGYDEFVPHGLFWGGMDYSWLVHGYKYAEAADLRGILFVGTAGQDYGFWPRAYVYLVRPSERIAVVLDLDLRSPREFGDIGSDESGIKAGNQVVSREIGDRTGDLGTRMQEIDAFLDSLTVSR